MMENVSERSDTEQAREREKEGIKSRVQRRGIRHTNEKKDKEKRMTEVVKREIREKEKREERESG